MAIKQFQESQHDSFLQKKTLSKIREAPGLGTALVSVFAVAEVIGGHAFGWMDNSYCFTYLNCNAGFFGYDAFVHFLGGIIEVIFIFWLAEKFSQFNFFQKSFWKNFTILMALVALLSVGWELGEFSYDTVRMNIFHEDLVHPTDRLRQVNNDDTMGDFFFGLFGAILMIAILEISDRKQLTAKGDNSKTI